MALKLHFGKPESYDYNTLLDQLSGTKLNSIKTSSVPLMQFWKNTNERVVQLWNYLELKTDSEYQLCFEYPTSPQKGKGKASMTDLMILHGNDKIAIEAKYTEYLKPPEDIKKWLGSENKNKELVLSYWEDLISPFSNGINQDDKKEVDYQFFHRTASACYNSTKPIVIYQIFYDDITFPKLGNFLDTLKKFKAVVNPNEKLRFFIWEIKAELLLSRIKKEDAFYLMKTSNVYEFSEERFFEI